MKMPSKIDVLAGLVALVGVTACGEADPLEEVDESCAVVTPEDSVDFGYVTHGDEVDREITVENCDDDVELVVLRPEIVGEAPDQFAADEERVEIAPGDDESLRVGYDPDEEGDHVARLELSTNGEVEPTRHLELLGEAGPHECPIAEATGGSEEAWQEGSEVATRSYDEVQLSGRESTDPDGTELAFDWRLVERPDISRASFEPSSEEESPELPIDVPGDYRVELTVVDDHGIASCEPATVEIEAVRDHDVHVLLTWEPVGDEEPTTDLDVHYIHEEGSWGDDQWSVHPLNDSAFWDDSEVHHDFDSLTGERPENIYHDDAEEGRTYSVGVHRLTGQETVEATVAVWVEGERVFVDSEEIEADETLWYVGDVEWSDEPEFEDVDTEIEDHPL